MTSEMVEELREAAGQAARDGAGEMVDEVQEGGTRHGAGRYGAGARRSRFEAGAGRR